MRFLVTGFAITVFSLGLNPSFAHECDTVLVQNIRTENRDLRFMLDAMSTFEQSGASKNDSGTGLDATIPIEGIPVTFGFESKRSNENRQYLSRYNHHKISREESIGIMTKSVDSEQVRAWSECMARDTPFILAIDEVSGSDNVINLIAKNYIPGDKLPRTMKLSLTGGSLDGSDDIEVRIKNVGDNPFRINRIAGKKLTIFASVDGYSSSVALPAPRQPYKTPDIQYRVNGNLQQATITNEIYETHNFEVTKGVLFHQSDIRLTIEQLVDGKTCQIASIATNSLGDMMDSTPLFKDDRMYAGCQAKDAGGGNAISVQCFVDPLHPMFCQ